MRILVKAAVFWVVAMMAAAAEEDKSGEFDYYVLALSWSPNWCQLEGNDKNSPQCSRDKDFGWVVHGLWPQFERGWPSYCSSPHRPPSRRDTKAQASLFGSAGSAWHQWKKHGSCSGLTPAAYYQKTQEAFDSVNRPKVFRQLDEEVRLPASLVKKAFLKQNQDWKDNSLRVTCRENYIAEVRICLTKDLSLRACSPAVKSGCKSSNALFYNIQ